MADRLEVELNLNDAVSAPATKAAAALRKVEEATNKAQKAMHFGDEIGKAHAKLAKLANDPGGYKKLLHLQKELSEAQSKMGKTSWLGAGAEEFGHKLRNAVAAAAIAEVIIGGVEKAVDLLKEGVKLAFEEGGKEERRRTAYKLSLGAVAGKESMEDSARFSKQTKFTETEAQDMMLPLLRAGMSQAAARQAFATSADVEAGGGPRTQEMLEVFQKIQNKGGISGKMLMAAQINQPEFFKSLAKSLKVSSEEAKKRAESGAINPQLLMNTITQAVNKRQGGAAGTGAMMDENTMESKLHKLRALPEEFMKHMVDSPGWNTLKNKLGALLNQLDPESANGKRVMDALLSSFNALETALAKAITPEKIEDFSIALEKGVRLVAEIPGYLSTALKITEGIAAVWATVKVGQGLSKLAEAAPGIGTAAGTAVRGASAVSARGLAVGVGGATLGMAAGALFMSGESATTKDQDAKQAALVAAGAMRENKHWWGSTYEDVVKPAQRNGGGGNQTIAPVINISMERHKGEDAATSGARAGQAAAQPLSQVLEQHRSQAGL